MPNKHIVTKEMRSIHYDKFGYMVKDSEILAWFKGHNIKSKEEKK